RPCGPRLGFDRRQRDRFRERLHRLDVDREKHALLVGGIVIALADHLGDADDLLLLASVIEQRALALLHLLEIPAGGEVAHAGPPLALGAAFDLIVPGKNVGLGFLKPVGHRFFLLPCLAGSLVFVIAGLDPAIHPLLKNVRAYLRSRWSARNRVYPISGCFSCASRINPACVVKPAGDCNIYPSARNGRVNNVSVASSTLARPARMSTTALAIGMSTPFAFAISTSTGAVKMPSASAPPACAASPRPRAMP